MHSRLSTSTRSRDIGVAERRQRLVDYLLPSQVHGRLRLCLHHRHGFCCRASPRVSGLLDQIEALKFKADALDLELREASRIAEVAAKRSRRLASRSQELQAYALEHVQLGDESAARAALLQKASVAHALAEATRRAEANSALARKLEDVLTSTQAQLVDLIRQAKEESHAGEPAATAYTVTVAVARSDTEDGSAGLKRSDSVAWSSASLHASSDMWEQQLDATPEQQTQAGHIVNTQSSVVTAEGVIRAYELGDQR